MSVLLLAMPWQAVYQPSIQTGLLKRVLTRAGIPATTSSLAFDFLEHCLRATGDARARLKEYERIYVDRCDVGLCDWIFAGPPFADAPSASDGYAAYLRQQGVPERDIARAFAIREAVPRFLDACADRILAERPAVVGFTCTYTQLVPSLALGRVLKARDPRLQVVLGGAECDGPSGAAIHRTFPWVDVVVRGEAERVLPALVRDLLSGGPVTPQPGLCYREGGRPVEDTRPPVPVAIEDVPRPDYDDYFEQVARSSFRDSLVGEIELPYEASRGCWWGARSHCVFCSFDDTRIASRSHSPERVAGDLEALAARHRSLRVITVDRVIDPQQVRTLPPLVRALGCDFSIFFEVRTGLTRDEIRAMRDAGIDGVQPGIESLSTPILKLMRKGVTALQNVRFLKWCAECGVNVYWNLLWGLPQEPEEQYLRMADEVASLTHLQPPAPVRLGVARCSPYHEAPARFGLEILGPPAWMRWVYPDVDSASLEDLVCGFQYRYLDGRDPEAYTAPLMRAIHAWRTTTRTGFRSLRYKRGPGFLVIRDRRPSVQPADYTFGADEAGVYLACDGGATPAGVCRRMRDRGVELRAADVKTFLDGLTKQRLVYREGDRYLALALPDRLPEMRRPTELEPLADGSPP